MNKMIITATIVIGCGLTLVGCGSGHHGASHSASYQQGYARADRAASQVERRMTNPHAIVRPGHDCQIMLNQEVANERSPASTSDFMAGCYAAWTNHGYATP
jgi:hypothetical protein